MSQNAFSGLSLLPTDPISVIVGIMLGRPGGVDDVQTLRSLGAPGVARASMTERARRLAEMIQIVPGGFQVERLWPRMAVEGMIFQIPQNLRVRERLDLQSQVKLFGSDFWIHIASTGYIRWSPGPSGQVIILRISHRPENIHDVGFESSFDYFHADGKGWRNSTRPDWTQEERIFLARDFQPMPRAIFDIALAMLMRAAPQTPELAEIFRGAVESFEIGIRRVTDAWPIDWNEDGLPRLN